MEDLEATTIEKVDNPMITKRIPVHSTTKVVSENVSRIQDGSVICDIYFERPLDDRGKLHTGQISGGFNKVLRSNIATLSKLSA